MSLGKKLSGYRRDAGYTQQQLGDLLNVSAQAVSKWENDQAEPDLQMLRRLCLIYKIKMDDLFDEESAATERAPQAESAAPAGRAGSAEEKAPPSSAQAERKPLGQCVSCGKAVYKGNAARTVAGLYCRQCYQLYTAGVRGRAGRSPDYPSFWWGLLSFLIPVLGIILYLVWREDYHYRAGSCFRGFIGGLIVYVLGSILISVLVSCALFWV